MKTLYPDERTALYKALFCVFPRTGNELVIINYRHGTS